MKRALAMFLFATLAEPALAQPASGKCNECERSAVARLTAVENQLIAANAELRKISSSVAALQSATKRSPLYLTNPIGSMFVRSGGEITDPNGSVEANKIANSVCTTSFKYGSGTSLSWDDVAAQYPNPRSVRVTSMVCVD